MKESRKDESRSLSELASTQGPSHHTTGLRVASIKRLQATAAWPRINAIHGLLRKGDLRDELNIPFRGKDSINETVMQFLNENAFTGDPILDEAESAEMLKIRPFTRLPWKQWDSAPKEYYSYNNLGVGLDQLQEAAMAYLKSNGYVFNLKMLDLQTSITRMRKGTNLGMPYLTSAPEAWNGNVFKEYVSRARRLIAGNGQLNPFFMFWRITQGKAGAENKHRVVWGADHAETIAMLPFFYPVLDANNAKKGFRAFLGSAGYISAFSDMRSRLPKGHVWISGDVSKKDQSTNPLYVDLGFNLWQAMVPEIERIRDVMSEYYTRGELITPDGIYKGVHGRPSGIVPTGLFNTFDMIAAVSLFWIGLVNRPISELIGEFHGDDFVFACPDDYVDDFWPFMAKCGWEVNPDKSLVSATTFSYLQRYWTPNTDGYYPMSRVMARLMYSERVQPSFNVENSQKVGKVDADLRTLMLQIYSRLENASNHPKFSKLVEFVGSLDRYGLDPSVIGSRWKLREVLYPHTLGTRDNEIGLSETATYKVVTALTQEGKLRRKTDS